MSKRPAFRLAILLFIGACASAQEEGAKLSTLRVEFQGYVDRHEAAGTVTLVARKGKVLSLEAVGWRDLEARVPMKVDTIFQIASMTKPVTAIGIAMLEEEGTLSIDDPVEKLLPEFRGQQVVRQREGAASRTPVTSRQAVHHRPYGYTGVGRPSGRPQKAVFRTRF